MKLLHQYHSSRQAELSALLLEQQGIVAHVSSKHSQSLGGWVTGAFSVGLWAVFDHQFADAKAFIADHSHNVKTGFTIEEMADLKQHSEKDTYSSLNRFLIYTFLSLSVVTALFAIVIYTDW
jgi:hypothetical protein|tara:strand:+ start:3920 stop:4285 length:366 start_codon:yes stop_codon:yes gene_type:complete